ncbi:hypothetical protein SAMN05660772_02825 [Pasteurella testudinis DSM 23072]|uniref:Uncharacterized protein n=1 Tax=Pasteurella testudinis DSM 23072 TaxID=1122938 RepID=A0A1W1V650_9PAST|nr:hypothetical protein [Pasteurella testudinis]SMB88541.1 hypothetical protein SAMN05660772_02825 [Pasteurella testudinis DSM 23072]SUB51604.1 Uncharacterised protein [Pasteurella testudinis]
MRLKNPFDFKATYIIGALLLAIMLGVSCPPVTVTAQLEPNTVHYNHTADLTADIAQAKADWIAENGDLQPDLTAEQQAEILTLVEKMKEAQ